MWRRKTLCIDRNTTATDDKRQPAGAATTAKSSTGVVGAGIVNGKYGSSRQALEIKEEAQQFRLEKTTGKRQLRKLLVEEPASRNVEKTKVNPRKLHRCESKRYMVLWSTGGLQLHHCTSFCRT